MPSPSLGGEVRREPSPEIAGRGLPTALEALRVHPGIALVDLDETLYLRNTTEDFLDCVRPALPGLIVLTLLDALRPWTWTGGKATRDVWRVGVLLVLFPWTLPIWRHRVRELARLHANAPLLKALEGRAGPTAVATVGFRPIVIPLLDALGLGSLPLVASRIWSFADRRDGKLAQVLASLGEDAVSRALVLTDSLDDQPLLDRCACPVRVVWPGAAYVPALSRTYLPGKYVSGVKRPGTRYILRGVLQEDFALWVLASIGLAARPFPHLVGLGFLLLSFWALYERGYVDNDLMASRHEKDPTLSHEFSKSPVATPALQPWIWASVSGALGVYILGWPSPFSLPRFGAWAAVLVATFLWFRVYNRIDKRTRIWMYLPLQVARSAGFVAVTAISTVGALALAAHALSRWVHYTIYRMGPAGWPKVQSELMRLCIFLLLSGMIWLAEGPAIVLTWTTLAIVAWNLFRARSGLLTEIRSASRIVR